jgi:hypothetical protein
MNETSEERMMNDILPQILAELNLQPGQCQRVQVNGYHLEIRRPAEEESDFADTPMLQPWVEFPRGPGTPIPVKPGRLPLPDPPEIPADFEE